MEAVLAARISYMATTYNLLLKTHFGGWRKSCVETAIHHLLEKVYTVWNEGKITFFLMMDVFAAYPNTSYKHLLYNLQKRRIDKKAIDLVASF